MPAPDRRPYRPCVGVMLLNAENRAFVGRRIGILEGGHAWQMPQGGIDHGETPREAAFRELEEEVGTANAEIIAEAPDWIAYDLPAGAASRRFLGKYRGQTQKWFAMRFLGRDEEFDLETHHPEFDDWRWVPMLKLPALIVPFKRPAYEAVVAAFRHLLDAEAP